MSILRVENVATPLTAATDALPDNVPPAVFVMIASVTRLVVVSIVLPARSCTATEIGGMTAPGGVVTGWLMKPSWVGEPTVTSKAALVAGVRVGEDARSLYPDPVC